MKFTVQIRQTNDDLLETESNDSAWSVENKWNTLARQGEAAIAIGTLIIPLTSIQCITIVPMEGAE